MDKMYLQKKWRRCVGRKKSKGRGKRMKRK
jgi:hypothetical protein